MDIIYHKNFTKAFLKLPARTRDKVKKAIELFQNDPYDIRLNNHALHGEDQGKRAISASGDLRVVFEVNDNYQSVTLLRVGTHNQVYK